MFFVNTIWLRLGSGFLFGKASMFCDPIPKYALLSFCENTAYQRICDKANRYFCQFPNFHLRLQSNATVIPPQSITVFISMKSSKKFLFFQYLLHLSHQYDMMYRFLKFPSLQVSTLFQHTQQSQKIFFNIQS